MTVVNFCATKIALAILVVTLVVVPGASNSGHFDIIIGGSSVHIEGVIVQVPGAGYLATVAILVVTLLVSLFRYQELIALLPAEVKGDYYCQQLLECLSEIADHMCSVGPRGMSRKKLIQVLATLGAWELKAPDIAAAIEVN